MGEERRQTGHNGEECMVCGTEQPQGFHIVDQFICASCEQAIVKTDVEDPKYADYLSKLSILNIKRYYPVESGQIS